MSRAGTAVFAVLVAATFAAFFVAQRIKNAPSVVQRLAMARFFSPNGDGRFDTAWIRFRLKEADDVTVAILDAKGDKVRTLLDDRHMVAYRSVKPALRWDGRDDRGRLVPDGLYRLRITLRGQGRSITPGSSINKDTIPPKPLVTSMGPETTAGPELLPNPAGKPAEAHFGGVPRYRSRLLLFRTAPGRPRLVLERRLHTGQTSWSWDATAGGRRVSPGTYLVALQWRDQAGNIGTSVPLDAQGLPVLGHGPFSGRGGITVRYLAAQAPAEPVKARDPVTFLVDSRQKRYSWDIRRLGASGPRKRGGPKTKPVVNTAAPGGRSGVYLFEVRTRSRTTTVPFAVQARRPVAGTAQKPHGVLVVLPFITWQGRNPVDDDGDGAPNTLDAGGPARLRRPSATGLPQGFADTEAPMLLWLDRTGRDYDITTDAALLAGHGPTLTGHAGVLIPGDERWLPATVRNDLRAFARRGGAVVSLGTDSLRRSVRLDGAGNLVRPSSPRATDVFGARLAPLVTHTTNLEIFQDDQIGLFAGTGGLIGGVAAWEPTVRVGEEADLVANAVTVNPQGKTVVIAARFGRGLVIRPGFPTFAARVNANDTAVSALMARMWTLLSR